MYNLCGVADDAHLPEIHRLLAKAPKGKEYAILNAMLLERVGASTVPLTAATAPIATPKLANEVFREMQPYSTGQVFAQGLSPFSIVCEGHAEISQTKELLRKAQMAEAGTSVTLSCHHPHYQQRQVPIHRAGCS